MNIEQMFLSVIIRKRGLFVCEDGYRINADTNAAYQMMKKAGFGKKPPKTGEKVTRLQVA